MRYPVLLLFTLGLLDTIRAQNVGINADGATPHASAMLDINVSALPTGAKRGLLIPRMTSTERNNIATPSTGLMVYDQTVNSFWYYNSVAWVEMFVGSSVWGLSGNSATGSEKMGTLNAQPLRFYTNNVERIRILPTGQISVATTGTPFTPEPAYVFHVVAPGNTTAVSGTSKWGIVGEITNSSITGGMAIYAKVVGSANNAVRGRSQHKDSFGLVGTNDTPEGTGLVASGNGLMDNQTYALAVGSAGAYTGRPAGIFSAARDLTGTGAIATGNGVGLPTLPTAGAGMAGIGTTFGVYGKANDNTVGGEQLTTRAGGYFESGSGATHAWSYVAGYGLDGGTGVPRKVLGNGTVNTVVKDTADQYVLLSAPEAPENLFQDYGTGRLVNGKAYIRLDPNLSKNITVNERHPLRVFVQLRGDCKGVYVTNETAEGFEVIELQGGTSDTPFFWNITANRGNQTHPDGTQWKFAEERFARTAGPQSTHQLELKRLPTMQDPDDLKKETGSTEPPRP